MFVDGNLKVFAHVIARCSIFIQYEVLLHAASGEDDLYIHIAEPAEPASYNMNTYAHMRVRARTKQQPKERRSQNG